MRFMKAGVCALTLFLSMPIWADSTYFGGFEDSSGANSDYDYNDLVFSISGTNLMLNTATGMLFNKSAAGVLNTSMGASGLSGTPFWNNSSLDGAGGLNVGWCIYGGGACNGGTGLAPNDQYIATAAGKSVNDIFFSVDGNVSEQVTLHIAGLTDTLGWELVGDNTIHYFGPNTQTATFAPGGNFILLATVSAGPTFDSNTTAADGVSHFAFFGNAITTTPEPASFALLGLGLLGSFAMRKKFHSAKK